MHGKIDTTRANGVDGTSNTNGTNGIYTKAPNGDAPHINGTSHLNGDTHPNGINGSSYTNGAHGMGDTSRLSEDGSKVEPSIPIAVCGMALRLPGGSASPQDFWEFLINKGDARSRVPESRYNVSAYHRTDKRPGAIASEYGYFLDDSVRLGAFDSSRFSLSRAELEYADPQQRRLLEVVREAFDDAGDVTFRGKAIGCYVGNMGEDWGEMMNRDPLSHGANRIDGYNDWMLGNRISYEFGLQGPSMTIRTACSSALVGLNDACAAMQRGVCEGAIVAGSTLIMAPGTTQSMTEKGILGPDGSCKTFSADANGYARGEAITAIYVKPLDAALRDGNPVRAVIRAAMSNSDGKTQGITQPNPDAHETMIRKAYQLAGIKDFSKTAYFECHGTGTAVGDPIETGAVANIFGDHGIHITSVKPNLGHTEGASGLVSLIKAVMSLENRTIPPNIKFNVPNPRIPFKERKLTVPIEPTPFPTDRHERVSVNSFGLGGSNAHVIVDSAASFNLPKPQRGERVQDVPQLLLFSAGSASSLKKMTKGYEDWLTRRPDMADKLDDLAYTLANRREHLSHRAFKVVGGSEIPSSSGKMAPNQAVNLVMVFTGQGAQWPRMGRELLLREDLVFQKTLKTLDEHLQGIPDPPTWKIEKELQKSSKTSQVQKAELSQPLCTAVQIGLVDLFATIGVEPAAVVGHSSGELAAAYAAGALTAKEAIIGAYQRGQAAKLQSRKGAMAAVGLGWDEVERFLSPPMCVVACENAPKSVTLSGDADEVKSVVARIKEEFPDITARLLKVEKAYHSYHMREVGGDYCTLIQPYLEGKRAQKPFFSSVTGSGEAEQRILGTKYWQQNLESPVLFSRAVSGILKHIRNPVFLEIGPHGALAGPARQIFAQASASPPYVSAMARNEDCVESYLKAVGQLFELNAPIDYEALTPAGTCLSDLPRYPWNHDADELWYESRMSKEWRFAKFPRHPLLGRRQLESTSFDPSFRNLLNVEDAPWLRDHMIQGTIIFPAAGYVAMAGEAIRQLSGVENPYRLRHVVLSQALILQEGVDIEVVTNLRSHRLNDAIDSEWWEFTIASHNGQIWVKHCTGQVSHGQYKRAQAECTGPLARKLEKKKVFDTLAEAGMEYGPGFQRLEDITAGTVDRTSASNLTRDLNVDEDHYHLHPAVIDAALQSGLIAANQGKLDGTNCAAMPTVLEHVEIFPCAPDADMQVTASTQVQPGEISGRFQCTADGEVVLNIPEARFKSLEQGQKQEKHHLPITARVTWGQHIDFLDEATLIKPEVSRDEWTPLLDELGQLCIIFFQRRIESATNLSDSPTIQNFVTWIGRQTKLLGKDHPSHALENGAIIEKAHNLGDRMANSPVAACAESLLTVGGNIDQLLSGDKDLLELLDEDDNLTKLYATGNTVDRTRFIQSVAHAKPNLRVLEIGASTGGSTAAILKDLVLPMGKPLYSTYTYTDASSPPLANAKRRFQDLSNIEYRTLDISKDPAEQGFEKDKYDLIVATNAIHATPSLFESLVNVRKLLSSNGRFLLQELQLHTESKWINCIFGLLEEWWLGEQDGRSDEPYVEPARWQSELRRAGFADPITVLDDEEHQLNAVIIAKPAVTSPERINRAVTIVSDDDVKGAEALSQQLQSRGHNVDRRRLGDEIPESQDVISILDESGPFFENTNETRFKALQKLLADLGQSGLLWITRPSQMQCNDPRYAQVIGAARSIRNEEHLDFATCEVDDLESSLDVVVDVFTHFQRRQEDEVLRPDCEYAIFNGLVHVPRIYPFLFKDDSPSESSAESRVTLEAETPGRLSSLRWVSRGAKELVGKQVEVQVFAAGISYKDVSEVLGYTPLPEGGLGMDSSGVVSRVGPEVQEFAVGDRVMCLGAGNFASHVVTPDALCARIPDNLSFEEAATMPAAYATAMAAFYDIGNLRPRQSVLIHSACGGVGMAAMQLAKMVGADIYATVGSEEKVQYLMATFGLPRNRIFDSRDASFVQGIKRETDGQGVDLALNLLSGDLLHATWECIAEFGKMVEIGQRDLVAAGKLDMKSFLGGRSYSCLSLDALLAKRQLTVKRLLHSTMRLLKDGHITPLGPRVAFDASSSEEALRHLQQGQHIGKVVLTMRDADGKLKIDSTPARAVEEIKVDGSASYLLAGGLGGIATVIARYLVENGARHLVCLSRNPGSKPEDVDTIQELESMGCEVILVKGDLISKDDISNAVQQARNLKGILHAPMLLADANFRNMTLEQWNKVSDPKVKGAWYLHEAVMDRGIDLDFFVLLSSMSGLNGQPGQANYAGANTFLDAFAQYRDNMGLVASSIELGAVADMGYAARDEALLKRLITNGYSGVTQPEMIEAFAAAASSYPASKSVDDLKKQSETFVHLNTFATGFGSTVSLSSPESRSWWKKDIRMAVWHNISDGTDDDNAAGGNNSLKAFLAKAKNEPDILGQPETVSYISLEIGKQLMNLLLRSEDELDVTLPLAQLGLDSLVSIEMRTWWRQTFGADITVLQMLGLGSLEELGKHAVEQLLQAST